MKSDTLLTRVAKQGKKGKYRAQVQKPTFIHHQTPFIITNIQTYMKKNEKALGNEIKQHTEKKRM